MRILIAILILLNVVWAIEEEEFTIKTPDTFGQEKSFEMDEAFLENVSEDERRDLQESKPITGCNDSRLRASCYYCQGLSKGECAWNRGVCSNNNNRVTYSSKEWYKNYESCPDTQNLNLCRQFSSNSTYYQLLMTYTDWSNPKLWLPQQHFCKWTFLIDQSLDVKWQLYIQRKLSVKYTETLQIVAHYNKDRQGYATRYDDQYLRDKSFIYQDNVKKGLLKYTSHANIPIKEGIVLLDIYARNNAEMRPNSFEIAIKSYVPYVSWMTYMFSAITTIIFVMLMLVCLGRCFRDCGDFGSRPNYNVQMVDPQWDEDQVRVYNIRRLQQQLDDEMEGMDSNMEEMEEDRINRQDIQRKLQQAQMENAMEFIGSIENLEYDRSQQQFDIRDCIICMESFEDGERVQRIPTCKHVFHEGCLRKWFTSKTSEDEQRCPQCNTVLKTQEMKDAKLANEDANFVQPAVRGSPNDNSVAPSNSEVNGGYHNDSSMSGDSDIQQKR